jgi:hypothetical protein
MAQSHLFTLTTRPSSGLSDVAIVEIDASVSLSSKSSSFVTIMTSILTFSTLPRLTTCSLTLLLDRSGTFFTATLTPFGCLQTAEPSDYNNYRHHQTNHNATLMFCLDAYNLQFDGVRTPLTKLQPETMRRQLGITGRNT